MTLSSCHQSSTPPAGSCDGRGSPESELSVLNVPPKPAAMAVTGEMLPCNLLLQERKISVAKKSLFWSSSPMSNTRSVAAVADSCNILFCTAFYANTNVMLVGL